ncbi:unnamed protein product, partial [Closterium sp. NIES-64]
GTLPSRLPATRRRQQQCWSTQGLWERLDMDVLFFAFYHQQQYLAARELKKQSVALLLRRAQHVVPSFHALPFPSRQPPARGAQLTTDDYEQGTYVYFDFHIVHDDYQTDGESTGWGDASVERLRESKRAV